MNVLEKRKSPLPLPYVPQRAREIRLSKRVLKVQRDGTFMPKRSCMVLEKILYNDDAKTGGGHSVNHLMADQVSITHWSILTDNTQANSETGIQHRIST